MILNLTRIRRRHCIYSMTRLTSIVTKFVTILSMRFAAAFPVWCNHINVILGKLFIKRIGVVGTVACQHFQTMAEVAEPYRSVLGCPDSGEPFCRSIPLTCLYPIHSIFVHGDERPWSKTSSSPVQAA